MIKAHERLPKLKQFPLMLPSENLVRIEWQEGIPLFKATRSVHKRIELLLAKQRQGGLTSAEGEELDGYEELDDYLSFANRVMRILIPESGAGTRSS